MSSQYYCIICLMIILHLKFIKATNPHLRPLMSPASTYKPSTLLLPPGFDSQKAPVKPMLYPYAVSPSSSSSSSISLRPKLINIPSTTPDWIPVALNVRSDLPFKTNSFSTTSTLSSHPVSISKGRITSKDPKYSSPPYKQVGPVFESVVYGTWKPDPPLLPVAIFNSTSTHQHQHGGGIISNISEGLVVVDKKVYNKTISRQHGGFIGQLPQKPTKPDRQIFASSTWSSNQYKPKNATEIRSEQNLQRKVKKQGRRKIRPIVGSTTDHSPIETTSNGEQAATTTMMTTTTTTATTESMQHLENAIKINSTDSKLMEVAKQINESIEIKYNHKQTSTHSIDMMTIADANDYDDYADEDDDDDTYDISNTQWATAQTKDFFTTESQPNYIDKAFEIFKNMNASRRSWPADFMKELHTTTTPDPNSSLIRYSHESQLNGSLAVDPSEIPLALSALNIPPSLWPKLPGNITKLGKPYEAESSAEEPALCVPITVQEQNTMHTKELVYIERVFCFPMPPSSTTSENRPSSIDSSTITTTTTFRTVTRTKVQNFNDFIDPNSRISNVSTRSILKHHFYLVAGILITYFKFIL